MGVPPFSPSGPSPMGDINPGPFPGTAATSMSKHDLSSCLTAMTETWLNQTLLDGFIFIFTLISI